MTAGVNGVDIGAAVRLFAQLASIRPTSCFSTSEKNFRASGQGRVSLVVIRDMNRQRYAPPNNFWRGSMVPDPTAEIKRIRHQLGADDDFDLDRIFDRVRREQSESGRKCVRRPPQKPANHAMQVRTGKI